MSAVKNTKIHSRGIKEECKYFFCLCLFVSLSGSSQDYTKTTGRINTELGGGMRFGSAKKLITFRWIQDLVKQGRMSIDFS